MFKKALVTGACGFGGSHMVDYLIDQGISVVATDLDSAEKTFLNSKATFIPSDLTDKSSLDAILKAHKIDVIYHVAALFDYEASWELMKKVNVDGTENLFVSAMENGSPRILMWSTVSVYGGAPPEELPLQEDSIMRPGTIYERSKFLQEKVAERYVKKGLKITTIRPAPIYGPRNRYGMATLIFNVSKLMAVPVPTTLTGHSVGVHVKDVCRASYFLSQRDDTVGEAYNVVDDSKYTSADMLKFFGEVVGYIPFNVWVPYKLLIDGAMLTAKFSRWFGKMINQRPLLEQDMVYYLQFDYAFDNSKLKELGFTYEYPDTKKGLTETINWYFENGWLDKDKLFFKVKNLIHA